MDQLREQQNALALVWREYEKSNDNLQVMIRKEQEYIDAITQLRDQKDAREETIRQCYADMARNVSQIAELTQSINDLKVQILTERRHFQDLQSQRMVYARTVSSLYQTVVSLRAENERLVAECHHGKNVQSDYLAAFCRVSADLQSALKEAQAVSAQGVEYLYDDEHNTNDGDRGDDVLPGLRGDVVRATNCLSGAVVTSSTVGPVMWVLVEWEPPVDANDNDAVPERICLRIELNAALYMNASTPPKLKFTKGGKEFPLGHRLVHMLKLYLHRHWSAQGGFNPPLPPPSSDVITFDTDPRCVVPYVADEGGLITHLVRYAMLRMETYADFCVVCDHPIQYNKGLVVTCGSDLCEHSFHEVGVGYDAVGLERTAGTAPGLKPRSKANDTPREATTESPTVLMITYVLRNLPTAKHQAWVCSAGPKGYCAVKEMVQNGIPGHTLLIESGDLRDVDASCAEGSCLVTYFIPKTRTIECFRVGLAPKYVSHVAVYTNCACIPRVKVRNAFRGFLQDHSSLTTIDLSPLSLVTEIQTGFLRECTGLTSIDLSPLSRVTSIKDCFLEGCTGLTSLNLSPLSKLTEVYHGFLADCSGLMEIDLSPLSQVTEVQWGFLAGCSGLTTVDVSPLCRLMKIQVEFLMGCTGLTSLNLSALLGVTEVQMSFLEGCSGITKLDSPPPLCDDPPAGWSKVDNQWVREAVEEEDVSWGADVESSDEDIF